MQHPHPQDDNGAVAAAGPVRDVAGASGIEEGEDDEDGDGDGGYERRGGGDATGVSSDLADMGL